MVNFKEIHHFFKVPEGVQLFPGGGSNCLFPIEIISTVILLPSADSFKKSCCQLQAKVCAQITG